MPVTIEELPDLVGTKTLLQMKDGVPTPPPPYATSIQEYFLKHEPPPQPGRPEVFTKGVLYRAAVPNDAERWLATIVVLHAVDVDAHYTTGKTFRVDIPGDQYDPVHDDELKRLLKAEV